MTIEIVKKLDEANKKLDTLLQWRAGLEERCIAHRKETDEVRGTLYNKPNGVVACVNRLTMSQKSASRWNDFWVYILKVVIAACVIWLVAWLLSIYRYSSLEIIPTSTLNERQKNMEN